MSKSTPVQTRNGGTQWRRFALLLVPSLLLGGGMLVLTANGSMAASFAVSATSFKITADKLEGEGFAQYGSVVVDGEDGEHPVAPAGIEVAKIYNLCQSAVYETDVGTFTIRISAGTDEPVEANNLVLDSDDLSGDAVFENIEIGRDASTMDQVSDHQGPEGAFGQQSDTITITNVKGQNWAVNAGTFKLNDLELTVRSGKDECY
ncbi:MAG: DUF6230 family protein [Stackebrandtia sp.]